MTVTRSGLVYDVKPQPYTGDVCGQCGAMTCVQNWNNLRCVTCGWERYTSKNGAVTWELLPDVLAPNVLDQSWRGDLREFATRILARVREYDAAILAEPDDARLAGHGVDLAADIRRMCEGR